MNIDHCITVCDHPLIPLKEKGKKAVIRNPLRHIHLVIRIDDCVIREGKRADYLLGCSGFGDLIIELKGKDVEHGIEQVISTAEYWKANHSEGARLAGLIVSCHVPRTNSVIQKAKNRYRKRFKAPLKFCGHNQEHDLEDLFRF